MSTWRVGGPRLREPQNTSYNLHITAVFNCCDVSTMTWAYPLMNSTVFVKCETVESRQSRWGRATFNVQHFQRQWSVYYSDPNAEHHLLSLLLPLLAASLAFFFHLSLSTISTLGRRQPKESLPSGSRTLSVLYVFLTRANNFLVYFSCTSCHCKRTHLFPYADTISSALPP